MPHSTHFFHSLPYILRPIRKLSCSSLVQRPVCSWPVSTTLPGCGLLSLYDDIWAGWGGAAPSSSSSSDSYSSLAPALLRLYSKRESAMPTMVVGAKGDAPDVEDAAGDMMPLSLWPDGRTTRIGLAEGRDASRGRFCAFAAESSPSSLATAATVNPCIRLLPLPPPSSSVAGVGPLRGGDLDLVLLDIVCAGWERRDVCVQLLASYVPNGVCVFVC